MTKSSHFQSFTEQNIIQNLSIENITPPNPVEEKAKVLTQIQQAYQKGIQYYQIGNLALAEQELSKVLRPVLSKSSMKSLYIDDCNKEEILSAMYYLGQIYLRSKQYFNNYAKAAGIFQYCAEFTKKYNIEQFSVNGKQIDFVEKALLVQEKFLYSLNKININDLPLEQRIANYRQEISEYKDSLTQMREEARERVTAIRDWSIEEIATRAKVVEEIYKECTNFFVNNEANKKQTPGLIQIMIAKCFDQLGNPPKGCEYSFIGFGSLAGGRMTPWSDLEFAVLINEDKEEYKEYFRNLTKLLHIKVVNLGETPLRSLAVQALNNFTTGNTEDEWFYDDVLKSGFSFDGPDWHANKLPLGRQGNYKVKSKLKNENGIETEVVINKLDFELILTPRQLAEFQFETIEAVLCENDQAHTSWYKSDMYLVQSMRLVSLIDGSQLLLDDYRKQLLTVEKLEIVQKRTVEVLRGNIKSFSLKLDDDEEGKLIDVKKDIFRIGDRIIDSLANYYRITAEKGQSNLTAWQAIDKMRDTGILSQGGAQHLKEALSISVELRLATYCHNQGQNEIVSTYQPAVEHLTKEQSKKLMEETFYIKSTDILHYFYYVMLKVQDLVQGFCYQEYHDLSKIGLKYNQLFDDSNYNKGLVHARFLKYDDALKYMEAAEKDKPEDLDLLNSLFFLYRRTSRIEKAIILTKKILAILKSKYQYEPNHPDIAASYNNLGISYNNKEKYDKAIKYYDRALEIWLKVYEYNPNYPDSAKNIAGSYNNLGVVYWNKGEYEKAIKYHDQALQILQKIYEHSPNHLDIAINYNNLGNTYYYKGEYEKAIKYYNQALQIQLKVYQNSPNRSFIATSYNNLGETYSNIGDYEKTIKYLNLALEILQKAYEHNPNHPEIADCHNNLGIVYNNKGDHEKATKYHNQALEIYLKVYENNLNHPAISRIYINLGEIYRIKGKTEEAIKYYNQALKIQLKAYEHDPNHSEIAKSYNNLGAAYSYKQEYNEAIKFFNKSLEINLKAYEHSLNHPEIVKNYNNLGAAYSSREDYKKAIKYYNQALKIRLKTYEHNPNHPDIAKSYNNLGNVYGNIKDYEEAIKYYNKALEIYHIAYEHNPNHPKIANCYNNLGNACGNIKDYEEAIKYYNQALKMRLKAYEHNPNHPDIAVSYNNLGNAYGNIKDYEEAIKYYNQALEIYHIAYEHSFNRPDIAGCYNNLGEAYRITGENEKAIKYSSKALKMRLKTYEHNPNHPDIAVSYNNLGNAYGNIKDYEEAIKYYNKALKIYHIAYEHSFNRPDIAGCYNNLGEAYRITGENEKAIKYSNQALKMRLKAYEHNPNHPDIAASYNNLGNACGNIKDYETAIKYYNKALEIYLKVCKYSFNYSDIATSYYNIGLVYFRQCDLQLSFNYFEQALKIYNVLQNQMDINSCKTLRALNLFQFGNLALIENDFKTARDFYKQVDNNYEQIDFFSVEFIKLLFTQISIVHDLYAILAAINCQKVLIKVDSELKYGNHYHNLACFYASADNIKEANETFIIGLNHPNTKKTGSLYTEYAQFLILNKDDIALNIVPQQISSLLYQAVTSNDNSSLSYGKLDQSSVCYIIKNLIEQEIAPIGVPSQILAYYLLITNLEYVAGGDNIENLLKSFADYCESIQDEISYKLLADAYASNGNDELAIQYFEYAEQINKTYSNSNIDNKDGLITNNKITKNFETIFSEGMVAYREKNYDEAIQKLNLAIKSVNESSIDNKEQIKSDIYFNIGRAYHERGNLQKALDYYQETLEYNENHDKASIYIYKCMKEIDQKSNVQLNLESSQDSSSLISQLENLPSLSNEEISTLGDTDQNI